MTIRSTQEALMAILRRDYDFDIPPEDLGKLGPRDCGLDSLSEAELYLELSEQLNLTEVTSPPSANTFEDVIIHFARLAEKQ